MTEQSRIEWTDATFNPWVGCRKVSPACDHCYAERWSKRSGQVVWGEARKRTSVQNWNNPRRWNAKADAFEAEHGRPRKVFCASLADVFDNEVQEEWRSDLWDLIRECDRLTWLLLTKRPKLGNDYLPADLRNRRNVWVGTTVENRKMFDLRVPLLRKIETPVRLLSVEPLLEHMPLTPADLAGIGWVLVGGESGAGYREIKLEWARYWRDVCLDLGIPFHFKQWSGLRPKDLGRKLDGRTWDQCPNIDSMERAA